MEKKRFVVVEGLNSVEKDGFCQRLAARLGWKVDSSQGDEESYEFFLQKYQGKEVVFSQSHIMVDSESQYWRGKNVFSPIQKKALDTEVWKGGLFLFYRKSPPHYEEDDEMAHKRKIMESRRELIYWLNAQNVNRMTIHAETDSESEIIERVVRMFQLPTHSGPRPMNKEIIVVTTMA